MAGVCQKPKTSIKSCFGNGGSGCWLVVVVVAEKTWDQYPSGDPFIKCACVGCRARFEVKRRNKLTESFIFMRRYAK